MQKVLNCSSCLCRAAVGREYGTNTGLAVGSKPINSVQVGLLRERHCGMGCCTDASCLFLSGESLSILYELRSAPRREHVDVYCRLTNEPTRFLQTWNAVSIEIRAILNVYKVVFRSGATSRPVPQVQGNCCMLVPIASSSAAAATAAFAR